MSKAISLFDYHKIQIKNLYPNITDEELTTRARNNTLNECAVIPGFPNKDLMVNLSGQKYEKKECMSNLAFLPEPYNGKTNFIIEYKEQILLNGNNLRIIRKILETVNTDEYLVFEENSEKVFYARGIAASSEIESKLIPVIQICGHLHWKAYISNVPLFEYINGNYYPTKQPFDRLVFEQRFKFCFASYFTADELNKKINALANTIELLSDYHHGTSIVFLLDKDDKNEYKNELNRLTKLKKGHGIQLKKALNLCDPSKENLTFLADIIRIDGGLLVNHEGFCQSIGCIFDGKVFQNFRGAPGRGSRYNSIKLYVECKRKNCHPCLGIIISDDGYIDII